MAALPNSLEVLSPRASCVDGVAVDDLGAPMTKAKAKRYAAVLSRLALHRDQWLLHHELTPFGVAIPAVRWERDFYNELAADLRLLSEGKRLPQKRKAVR